MLTIVDTLEIATMWNKKNIGALHKSLVNFIKMPITSILVHLQVCYVS
jgi:hypothetical protein